MGQFASFFSSLWSLDMDPKGESDIVQGEEPEDDIDDGDAPPAAAPAPASEPAAQGGVFQGEEAEEDIDDQGIFVVSIYLPFYLHCVASPILVTFVEAPPADRAAVTSSPSPDSAAPGVASSQSTPTSSKSKTRAIRNVQIQSELSIVIPSVRPFCDFFHFIFHAISGALCRDISLAKNPILHLRKETHEGH
jgi:hypothetical protein